MKTKENGRSMVEMLGVLAIIAVLSAGALAGYSKAMYKIKMNKMIEQISTIAMNVQTLAANDSEHSMTDQWLYENQLTAGFVPQEMIKDGKIWSPFKNRVSISPSISGTENNLEIAISGITSSQICSDLSSINWENVNASVVSLGPSGETIGPIIGGDWRDDGVIMDDCFVASVYGSTLNLPVPASVYGEICAQCSEDNPCDFDVLFEL